MAFQVYQDLQAYLVTAEPVFRVLKVSQAVQAEKVPQVRGVHQALDYQDLQVSKAPQVIQDLQEYQDRQVSEGYQESHCPV